jgi:hypothetical protein
MKYIFVAGAPGSKWSSVAKNIYYSNSIDRSDWRDHCVYQHEAQGATGALHSGAYFDPGQEYGAWFDRIDQFSAQQCETEFDRPFSGTGVRIIKSHQFCHNVDFLKQHWPQCAVVCVLRDPDASLGWWIRCGGFDITYPDYRAYYKDNSTMAKHIDQQNLALSRACDARSYTVVKNNQQLAQALSIDLPPAEYYQDYSAAGITVKIL